MKKNRKTIRISGFTALILLILYVALKGVHIENANIREDGKISEASSNSLFLLEDIPEFSGESYVEVNGNIPYFKEEEYTTKSFESYSELDSLGRCRAAYASIGVDLMPTTKREGIGSVKPTGWHTVKYDCIERKYLYNRSHLIGYQLTGENANEKNLITGTRYMNVQGMLPFENMVADYVKESDNHVLYRVTPIFQGDNLLAEGVLMEGWSVEDGGEGVCYNVFVYNVQPGIEIDYETGESRLTDSAQMIYILNTNTGKFHLSDCLNVQDISEKNREKYVGNRKTLIMQGYEPCGSCRP